MTTYILLLIPLIALILIGKLIFKHEFSFREMFIQAGITAIVLALLTVVGYQSQTYDTMIVNGSVTNLNAETRQCDQFWSDFPDSFCTNQYTRSVKTGETCTTVNKIRSCTPNYKTQYRSVYSWETRYFVETSLSDHEISREDRQGTIIPARFAEIKVGDPVSEEKSYTNYIKGAASTLFNQKLDQVAELAYPSVYDYYKIRRVYFINYPSNSAMVNEWNDEIAVINTVVSKKNANVILVVTGNKQIWAEQLAQGWDAHNINDIIVVVGMEGETISWVDVRSWSSNKMVEIVIRDEILNTKIIDKSRINDIIYTTIDEYYKPTSMEEFEYLAEDIQAPTWFYVLAGILLIIISPLVMYFFSRPENNF